MEQPVTQGPIYPGLVSGGPGQFEDVPKRRFADLGWSELALALGLLGGVAASLASLLVTLSVVDRKPFYIQNVLSSSLRSQLWATMLLSVVAVVLPSLVVVLATRGRAAPAVIRLADRLCPLILIGLLPSLFAYDLWSTRPLTFLLELTITVLVGEQLFTRWLKGMPEIFRAAERRVSRPRLERWLPLGLVILGAIAYTIYFSHYTLLHHRRFGTAAFDLGINVNWCHNALHGHPWRATVVFGNGTSNMLSNHAIFAMFLWLPLYALSPGPEVLLIYQSFMCGIAAVPLYLLAKELVPKSAAVIIAYAYLMFAPLHGPNFYDYHELLVALPFHFLLYLALLKERYRWAAVLAVIIYAHREDMPIGLAVLGLVLLATKLRPRAGAYLFVASVTVFVLIKFVLMPSLGSWWFADIYKELQPKGASGYGSIVQTILINPAYALSTVLREEKLIYFLHLFAPLVFLPLRRLWLLLLAIPGFFFTLMTTAYPPTVSIAFQYTTHWIPYIFLASILSLRLLRDDFGAARQWGAVVALALGVAAHTTTFGAVIQHENFTGGFFKVGFEESKEDKKLYADFKRLASKIPPEASVTATEREVPHVAARLNAFTLRSGHANADYLLVRAGESTDVLQDAFRTNRYGLVDRVGRTFYLFKKNHSSPETAAAMRELGIR